MEALSAGVRGKGPEPGRIAYFKIDWTQLSYAQPTPIRMRAITC